jgi:hypothetical protein
LDLAGVVAASGARSVAVVGTAKNVGKTVTMNYLAHELSARGLSVGLVSSGRDGETTDSFTGEPKPSVVPPEGSWVATAEGVLGESGGLLQIADVSDRPGLLGRLVLGRVVESSPLELVGPQSARELAAVVARLRALGADIVLVDGALDRVAAASPSVTDAAILSTGASSDQNLRLIAQKIASVVWLWSRTRPGDPQVRALSREILRRGTVAFLDKGVSYTARMTPYRTCLGFEEEILSRAGDAVFVVVSGAVSAKFLMEAGSWPERDDFAVIASSPVSVFTTEDLGVPIFVDEEIRLLAITVNPVSYREISHDPAQMVSAVAREVAKVSRRNLPVFDVVSGETGGKGVSGMAMG